MLIKFLSLGKEARIITLYRIMVNQSTLNVHLTTSKYGDFITSMSKLSHKIVINLTNITGKLTEAKPNTWSDIMLMPHYSSMT